MSKFKVGDKIKIRSWDSLAKEFKVDDRGGIDIGFSKPWFAPQMKKYCGRVLTVKEVTPSGFYRTEEAYDSIRWTFSDSMIESNDGKSIVIYKKDNKVIAVDKVTGKTAEALCNPDDKFDFYTGASIAYERLRGRMAPARVPKDKPKYFTGKVVCVKNGGDFTIGKIYEIKNGVLKDNTGWEFKAFTSVDNVNESLCSQFIEIVK